MHKSTNFYEIVFYRGGGRCFVTRCVNGYHCNMIFLVVEDKVCVFVLFYFV
jgi:hypothetical protein